MKKSTKQTAWAIVWLFVLSTGLLVLSHGAFVQMFGEYAHVPEILIVIAVFALAYWLCKNRETLGGKHHPRWGGDMRTLMTLVVGMQGDIRTAVLNHVRTKLGIGFDGQAMIGPKEDALLMKWFLDYGYISKAAVGKAVHERLCEIGRIVYERDILSWHQFPDGALVLSNALGYAILHGAVSAEEVKNIRFDHNEAAKEYARAAEGLHENVMRQLASGDAYFRSEFSGGDDCCCCDYC